MRVQVEEFRLAEHHLVVEVMVGDQDVEIEQQVGQLGQLAG